MQVRTLVFGLVLGSAGFAAGRVARSAPDAPPACVATRAPIAPVLVDDPVAAPDDPGDAEDVAEPDDTDGVDIGEVIAHAEMQSREERREHNAIAGQVRDVAYNAAVVGCTVVVTSPALQGAQTAITDEHGSFSIIDLPAATYLVTYYYNDVTLERPGVVVSALGATTIDQRMDLDPPPVVVSDDYVMNVPAVRTFDGVVDAEGESFSSHDTIENTYVIDSNENSTLPQ